jgi:hypothetical protein
MIFNKIFELLVLGGGKQPLYFFALTLGQIALVTWVIFKKEVIFKHILVANLYPAFLFCILVFAELTDRISNTAQGGNSFLLEFAPNFLLAINLFWQKRWRKIAPIKIFDRFLIFACSLWQVFIAFAYVAFGIV